MSLSTKPLRTRFAHAANVVLSVGLLAGTMSASAVELVTAAEAARPDLELPATRGITRGPLIKQVLPAMDAGAVRSPLQLKIEFKARGGAHIDVHSLQLTYLKTPVVDLSSRVASGVTEAGLQMDGVTLPPGHHSILVKVSDSEGRESESTFQVDVVR
jgi:hypothetical protein